VGVGVGVQLSQPAHCSPGIASNPQNVNGTSLCCPGPHSLDWGPQWKWGGAQEGREGRSAGRTTLDDYGPALKTHDWG